MSNMPTVLFHILAKDKGKLLEHWLDTQVDKIDYPKDKIGLYIRTNDNNDDTQEILERWLDKQYKLDWKEIVYDSESVDAEIKQYAPHEWNATRFRVLAMLRQDGVSYAEKEGYDFYYVQDVDNFVQPYTLRKLVSYDLPVVAPLIRYAMGKKEHQPYANYHNLATENGYFRDNPQYYQILNGQVRGLIQCDVVHCTYLIKHNVIQQACYTDATDDYEYVIFSRTLRRYLTPQYLDNTQIYGYLTLDEDLEAVKRAMETLK